MMYRLICVSLLFATLGALTSCGGGATTPEGQMKDAKSAMMAKEYEKALSLYDGVTSWTGEGTVKDSDKVQATLESVNCLIALGRAEDGVLRFRKMYDTFPQEMSSDTAYKKALTVISSLIQEKVTPSITIDLLGLAGEKHAAQNENFKKMAVKLNEQQDLSDEDLAELRKLGYL